MKKAQVTLFVILGLITVLMVSIGIYYISSQELESVPEQRTFSQTHDQRLSNVVSVIETCMGEIAKEELKRISLQGGLANTSTLRYDFQRASVNNAIQLFPQSQQIVPLWYYFSGSPSCQDCQFVIRIPPLEGPGSIQQSIEQKINSEILNCVNNFNDFQQILSVSYGTPQSTVQFNLENTLIGLEWHLNVTDLATQDRLSAQLYSKNLDIRFKDIYESARAILNNKIINSGSLDQFAITLLDYVSLSSDLPPTGAQATLSLTPTLNYWLLSDVIKILRSEIANNINFMQVENSKYYNLPFSDDSLVQSIYGAFVHQVSNAPYLPRLRVRFDYFEDWPIDVRVNPSSGEFIRPQSIPVNALFIRLEQQLYDFDYDIKFPVLVTIEDEDAFGGEGFILRFGAQANLHRGFRLGDEFQVSDEDPIVSFSDILQGTIPVKITTINGYTNAPIELPIYYECVDQSYYLGQTQNKNGIAILEGLVPPCINGVFTVIDADYYMEPKIKTITSDSNVLLVAYPKKEMTFSIKKKVFDSRRFVAQQVPQTDWTFTNQSISFLPDETVVLVLNSVDLQGNPTGIINMLELNNSNQYSGTIDVAPGYYELLIVSLLNLGEEYGLPYFQTNNETYTVGSSGFLGIGSTRQRIHINSTQINDSLLTGINILGFDSQPILFTADQILQNNHVDLFIPSYRIEDVVYTRDLEILGFVAEASEKYREQLLPVFS